LQWFKGLVNNAKPFFGAKIGAKLKLSILNKH
jgi:hypothetical protein